jgi:AcrR family transcriptional regulator
VSNQGFSRPNAPKVPTRHDRRKQETRARILASATELFGEQGVQSTKVTEICERADIAHQTFFNHFPSRRDLLIEISKVGIDFITAAMDASCQQVSSTRERLRTFLDTMTTATIEVGPMHRELMTEVMYASPESHGEERSRRIHDAFEQLIRIGLDQGDVTRRHELDVLVQLSVGAYYVLMSDWAIQPDFDAERRTAQMADLLSDSLEPRPDEATR